MYIKGKNNYEIVYSKSFKINVNINYLTRVHFLLCVYVQLFNRYLIFRIVILLIYYIIIQQLVI